MSPVQGGVRAGALPILFGLGPILLFLLVFFVGPLLVNAERSLVSTAGEFLGLTQYGRILGDGYYLRVILDTLLLGAVVTVACALLGYPLGYAVARSRGTARTLLIFAVIVPLLVNVVVRSFGWMVLLSGSGALNWFLGLVGLPSTSLMYSWTGVTIAMIHVLLPFMVLAIASTLETLDPALEEAAGVLGANRARVFVHVVLPLSFEGLLTGSILVFTLTVGSFVTVMLLGSTSTMVMPLLIYQQLTVVSDWSFAAAMGVTLVVIVSAVLWLQSRLRVVKWRQ